MSVPDEIFFGSEVKLNVQARVAQLQKKNKMSLNDDSMAEYLAGELQKMNMVFEEQPFKVPKRLQGENFENKGKNYFSLLKGRRTFNSECFLITFDYKNSYDVAAVMTFLDFYQTRGKIYPNQKLSKKFFIFFLLLKFQTLFALLE